MTVSVRNVINTCITCIRQNMSAPFLMRCLLGNLHKISANFKYFCFSFLRAYIATLSMNKFSLRLTCKCNVRLNQLGTKRTWRTKIMTLKYSDDGIQTMRPFQ